MGKWNYVIGGIVVLAIAAFILLPEGGLLNPPSNELPPSEFGSCMKDAGVIFYGAYWCPACKQQKEILGDAAEYPYVECDKGGKNANPDACVQAGVQSYPTWVIDGQKYEGVLSADKLEELTGCSV